MMVNEALNKSVDGNIGGGDFVDYNTHIIASKSTIERPLMTDGSTMNGL